MLFCMPALAPGLFMDHWGWSSIAWLFVIVTVFAASLIVGIGTIEWIASPKGTTRTRPGLVYMAVVASYALLSALLGGWWVEYRLISLCEHLQSQIRSLPPGTKLESIQFASTHRLIFTRATVELFLDEQSRISFLVEDQRDLFFSGYYVNADEIRYVRD